MTPRTPARLMILFAPEAPVAVIYRWGPSKWTQMWLWNTDADEFTPGQWIRGRVHKDSTLSPDGRYVISRIMGRVQHTALSRPPYFTALAVTVQSLCLGGGFFLKDGRVLDDWRRFHASRTTCPLRFVVRSREAEAQRIDNRLLEAREGFVFGQDQRGRRIVLSEGRIGVAEHGEIRWLADLDPYEPTDVPPPDWALDWSRSFERPGG